MVVILKLTGVGALRDVGEKDIWATQFSTVDTLAQTVASEFKKSDFKSLRFYGRALQIPQYTPEDHEADEDLPPPAPQPDRGAAIPLHDIVESVKMAMGETLREGETCHNSKLPFGDGFVVDWVGKQETLGETRASEIPPVGTHSKSSDIATDDIDGSTGKRRGPGRRETQPWHRETVEKVYEYMFR
jgi:hypothetical protein